MNLKSPFIILFSFIYFLQLNPINAQNIQFSIENFTPKEYGRKYEATNLTITQDKQGIIYFGTASGILEYDSKNWRYNTINKTLWITALAADTTNGIIYVGSQNEFGYFKPDSKGNLTYYSISDSLLNEQKGFSSILKVHVTKSGIVFQAKEKIYIYQKEKTTIIEPETSFHLSFSANSSIYVRQREIGLMKLQDSVLSLVSSDPLFKNNGIFAIIPNKKSRESLIIATYENGLFIFEKKDEKELIYKLKTNVDDYLTSSKIYGGIVLHDNNIALITLNGGLIILDQKGTLISIINKTHGLSGNDIKAIYQDKHQNIWLALNNGISKIDYNNPLSYYDEKSGLSGSIQSVIRFKNNLYIGTSNGLYIQKANCKKSDIKQFYKIPDFAKQIWNLTNANNSLIVGTSEGIYQIINKKPVLIKDINANSIYYSRKDNYLFVGGNQGINIFKKNKQWKHIKSINGIYENIIGIAENKSNRNSTELWLGTALQGVIRIQADNNLNAEIDKYDSFDGLNDDWAIPFKLNNNVVFGTQTGIFHFVHEKEVIKLLPDSLKDDKDFARGFFEPDTLFNTNNKAVHEVLDDNETIWFTTDLAINLSYKTDLNSIIDIPFKVLDKGKINTIYPDNNNIYWIGTADGLVRYQLDNDFNYKHNFSALIRKTTSIANDSIIDFGAKLKNPVIPSLVYSNNSLSFDYAATYYNNEVLFSYKLDGFNSNWSEWTTKSNKEYTNLFEGDYTFRIKAKNKFNTESSVSSYSFSIQSPWYRTYWAYIMYLIIIVIVVFIIIKISLHRLKVKNRKLEKIVSERTKEIRHQKEEIESQYKLATKQRDLITHQKEEITASIHYASRIQNAVIPSEEIISNILDNYFILYKPKDIVSGDFYWTGKQGDKIIIIAADCTGHGVPGAFMSMLGTAFLNEIVNKENITSPDEILNTLRKYVIKALKQEGEETNSKDGMDMAVFTLDINKKKLEFAGANNPLYLIRNQEIIETKANKMPVAIYIKMNPFTKHEIDLKKGDSLYMFSDGFADQFGGPKNRKFMYKPFKRLLLEMQEKPMNEQKTILDTAFEEWRGENEQIDDVLVIGINI